MQDFNKVNLTDLVRDAIVKLDDTTQSLATSFSGDAFPTNNVEKGMTCYRTDKEILYICTGVNEGGLNTWEEIGHVGINPGEDDKGQSVSVTYTTKEEMTTFQKAVEEMKSELTTLITEAKKMACPLVGDIICTKNSSNPSTKYPNTTWQLLGANQFLMSATTTTDIGKTGGSNTHTITAAEMPKHSHSITINSNGTHTHTRGSMNITGTFSGVGQNGDPPAVLSGAFYNAKAGGGTKNDNDGGKDDLFGFDASKSWTGETSSSGAHAHTAIIAEVGSGQTYDCRPAYISVFMWIRVA